MDIGKIREIQNPASSAFSGSFFVGQEISLMATWQGF